MPWKFGNMDMLVTILAILIIFLGCLQMAYFSYIIFIQVSVLVLDLICADGQIDITTFCTLWSSTWTPLSVKFLHARTAFLTLKPLEIATEMLVTSSIWRLLDVVITTFNSDLIVIVVLINAFFASNHLSTPLVPLTNITLTLSWDELESHWVDQ